jgi:addiction module HigA family antidote
MRISELVHGKRAITPDTALRLARHVGTAAEFWLGMQTSYDLELARERISPKINATILPRAASPGW